MFAVRRHPWFCQCRLTPALQTLLLACLLLPASATAEEIPASARPLQGWTVPGTTALTDGNRLFLTFSQPPAADTTLRLPRLVSVVRFIRWLEGSTAEMSVQPEPREWRVRVSGVPDLPKPVLVLTLDSPPRFFNALTPVAATADAVFLRACEAEVHGKNLRYEPQPQKNTVGYWSVAEDYAEWHCEVPASGSYDVDILQGCGAGQGGSRVEVSLQNQKLPLTVIETGHFQNFIWKPLGQATLQKTADMVLTVRCLKKQAGAVMDVRAVRITPVGKSRSLQPELAAPDLLPPSLRSPTDK
ncbi:MAG: hypothetical protein ACKO2P_21165 [Planctomycetota bacterium]